MTAHSRVETDPVGTLMPGECEHRLRVRNRLRIAQAFGASAAVSAKSERGRTLFWLINHAAADWTFEPAAVEELEDVREALLHLRLAANIFERVEGGAS